MLISRLHRMFGRITVMAPEGDGSGGGGDPISDIANLIPDGDDAQPQGDDLQQSGTGNGQQEQQAPPDDPDADPDDPVFDLEIDGQKRTIKQSELLAKAQKYMAGERRLEEAAQARKALEPEKVQLQGERAQLQQALGFYTNQLATFMQQSMPDWDRLLQENPTEYLRQRHAWDARMVELQRAQEAQTLLTQQQQREQATSARAHADAEQGRLLEVLPDWKDPAKAKAEAGAIDGYLQQAGFSDQERNGIVDHRVIVVARKAMLYDQLMAQQAQANNRVARTPPRAERPGASTQGQQGQRNRQAALDRHAKAPSIDTLAALLPD